MNAFLRVAAGLVLAALPVIATAQVNNPAYRDYFLVGQFGEICPMCEAMVLCRDAALPPSAPLVPLAGTFTLYHFHTRSFWSQMATIWEWFVTRFSTASLESGHRRPVTIHRVTDGAWAAPEPGEALVQLDPARIGFSDGREIDRRDRRWHTTGPRMENLGSCQRLPLWDALAVVEAKTTTAGPARAGAAR